MRTLSLEEFYALGFAEQVPFCSGANRYTSMVTDPEQKIAELLISTNQPNRKGHKLNPHGAILDNYRYNPVFMWNHLGHTDPVGIIGKTLNIRQTDDCIYATVQYSAGTEMSALCWGLESRGLLPGNSIGIRPVGELTEDNGIITIGAFELIDVSKVGVGADGKASNLLL